MRPCDHLAQIALLGLLALVAGPSEAVASPPSVERLEARVLQFEEECSSPETCLRYLGKSSYFLFNVLRACMPVAVELTDENEYTRDIKSRFLGYLWTVMTIVIEEGDTNRILSLQRALNHTTKWRAVQLVDDQDLFLWCIKELEDLGLLTETDLDDYRDSCRYHHLRSTRNEGFRVVQLQLGARGFPVKVDGLFGEKTVEALHAFQRSEGIGTSQFPDSATLVALGIDPDDFWAMSVSADLVKYFRKSGGGADPDDN